MNKTTGFKTIKDLKHYDKFEAANQHGLPTYVSSEDLKRFAEEWILNCKRKIKRIKMAGDINNDDINSNSELIELYAYISLLEHLFNI